MLESCRRASRESRHVSEIEARHEAHQEDSEPLRYRALCKTWTTWVTPIPTRAAAREWWHHEAMLLRALLVAFVAVCVVGCGIMGSCDERASFSVYANPNGVNISGYEAFDCTVTFSSQGRSAVTTMKARSAPTTVPPPVVPTMTDEVAACEAHAPLS